MNSDFVYDCLGRRVTTTFPSGSGNHMITVAVFLFPCLLLAMLSWREKAAMLVLLAAGLAAQQALLRWPWPALSGLDPVVQGNLVALNSMSVGALIAVLVFSLANLLRDVASANRQPGQPGSTG